MYTRYIKRLFDVVVASVGFVVLTPVFILVLLLLFIVNKGHVFFIQMRPGKNEVTFKLVKFKTMNDKKDDKGFLLSDEKRLTKIGDFVRKTSLDEIPQLINVIKGDMSLIGPRPLLIEYLKLYNETQKRRHLVKPGITGWAQVNGRNAISWEKKFDLDVWYVDNVSFKIDFKILLLTINRVVKSEGISSETSATMESFKGSV